ncbi:MAG: hypothetical protein JXA96_09710 [Sedimentisphaerales bacterium]|nr:hypothetical protein [Sedimentisphaerales bacterium]
MKKLISFFVFAFIIFSSTQSAQSAVTIIDLQGDKDGFGVGCPIASGLHYLDYGYYWADYREPGDPDFTDYWYEDDKSWTHTYDLMGLVPVSATLEIFVAGLADKAEWNGEVFVNGVSVGTILPDTSANDLTRILTFNIPVGLLINPDGVTVDVNNDLDGYTIDYSQLTIQAIPAPGALALCGIGTAMLGWLRKKRTL